MFLPTLFSYVSSALAACVVAPVSPSDGSAHPSDTPPTLDFSSSGCTSHTVELADNAGFRGTTVVRSRWPVGTTWTPSSSQWATVQSRGATTLWWRVRGPTSAETSATYSLNLYDPIVEAYACEEETYGSGSYLYCLEHADQATAALACEAWGGDLVTLDDAAEDAWVTSTSSAYEYASWWIGLYEPGEEDTWVWRSGSTAAFRNWAAGEPNDSGGDEDCAINNHNYGTQWNDMDCDRTFAFVCEG